MHDIPCYILKKKKIIFCSFIENISTLHVDDKQLQRIKTWSVISHSDDSRLIAISVVNHLLVAAGRLTARLTSIPTATLVSGQCLISVLVIQISHVLSKAFYWGVL